MRSFAVGAVSRAASIITAAGARRGRIAQFGAKQEWILPPRVASGFRAGSRNLSTHAASSQQQPSVAFIPILKHGGGGKGAEETYVLVLSKKPQDAINGFITIEPFTADLQRGEGLLNASSRALLDGTGLTASCAMDDSTKHIYSNPFNDSSTEQILGVVVDMSNPANASVHPGDKYALEGDEVVVIRSRISELSQSLDVLASNGRVIDTRIVAFALGSELGMASGSSRAAMPFLMERIGGLLGGAWMLLSIALGGAFFANNSGYDVSLPGIVT